TCGSITPACTPALSLNWNAYYIYDNRADYRYPALVVDGIGWVQGASGVPQNGVANWPEIFIAFYMRPLSSGFNNGDVELLEAFADDETCTGFQAGSLYWFTAQENASDGDGKVVAKPG